MRANGRLFLTLGATVLLAAGAYAQNPEPDSAPPPPPPGGHMHGPGGPGFGLGPFGMELLGFGGMHGGKVVTGAPFTATAVGESNRTLADGTKVSQRVQTNLYRDAQGRVRRETTFPAIGPLAASGAPKSLVFIHDPVAGSGYILDANKKIAHKLPQHPGKTASANGAEPDAARKAWADRPDRANVTKESLGSQTINGVLAEGTRYTRTIPAGHMGNDKPVTIVNEEWYSADLQMIVQSKRSDPFVGESTYSVTNIQRSAPSAALFSVPSDYTVKDAPAGMGKRGHGRKGGAPPPPPADAPGAGL
jgi:hypothetical protein